MNKYIVHLYREMKLSYADIEADTPQAAAAIAGGKPTGDADDIDDCDGQNLAALVDVAGDEDYSQSVTIDFEAERIRKAASRLLASLAALLPYAENEAYGLEKLKDSPEAEAEAERAWKAVEAAQAAVVEAKAAGIAVTQPSRFEFTHEPEENPDRAYVMVDGKFDVAIIRTAECIDIDVFPKDWIDPIDRLTVWDEQVAEASAEAEPADAGEA